MTCPSCRQDAPTIIRGFKAYCTACGAPRPLVSGTPVNVVGQPGKVGGSIARVLGWLVIFGGALFGLLAGLLVLLVSHGAGPALPIGLFFALFGLIAGLFLLFTGRTLHKRGTDEEHRVGEQAVFAIAARQRGVITAADVARALSITPAAADTLLTDLAKRGDGRVTLELGDDGALRYVVPEHMPAGRFADEIGRVRVPPDPATEAAKRAEAAREAEAEADAEGREARSRSALR